MLRVTETLRQSVVCNILLLNISIDMPLIGKQYSGYQIKIWRDL